MPPTTDFSAIACSIARASDILGQSWTPLIIRDLYCGIRRFDELRSDLGVARAVLSARLDRLIDDGLVTRVRYHESPPRYEYSLTPMGADLVPVLLALMRWGDRWLADEAGAPMGIRHVCCGHPTTPVVSCDQCGQQLTPDEVQPTPGPGGRTGLGTALIGTVVAKQR